MKRNDLSIEIKKYLMMSPISGCGGGNGPGRSTAQVLTAPTATEWLGRQKLRGVQCPASGLWLPRIGRGGKVVTGPLGVTSIQVYTSCEEP